uniref:Transmembrane and ubiquitin-like domain containing 2 n=1 Tax=Neogobius melanostomus TaxID=47308 RepID=A0A8C6UU13_9GOBI
MAVCALTMLDGIDDEVAAAGGVFLLLLALIVAWLSTHVADRGDHILGTILTVGAHASLIGLGGHDSYNTPEQPTPSQSQENKPEERGTDRGDGEGAGEGAEVAGSDALLDIRTKQQEDEEEEEQIKHSVKHVSPLTSDPPPTTTAISVRLKFLNDTEEVAVLEPQDTVGVLKNKYFSGREHQIKLIYQGHLLQDPKRTLKSLNISHNSVIHCHISQSLHESGPEEGAQSGSGAGTGGVSGGIMAASVTVSTSSLVVPVFVVILAVVWYFRINYRQFFTAPATISLVGVTVFFSFLIFGMHSR